MKMLHALAGLTLLTACAAGPGDAVPPANPYGAFLAARYADAAGDPATAAHYYTIALAADPGNTTLLNADFLAAMLAGDPSAVTLAGQIQGNALAVMVRGNQAALGQDYIGAAQDFGELTPDGLTGLVKPLLISWVQMGAGDPTGALNLLGQNFSNPGFGSVYVLNAALIADASGDDKDAVKLYAAVSGNEPNLRLAQILASWLARQGNPAGAQAELATLMQTHPDLNLALPALTAADTQPVISTPTQGLAEAYLTLAGSLNQPQQDLLKISFLRFALTLRPDLAAARLLLASTLAGADQPQNAATPPVAALNAALAVLQPIPPADPLYAPAILQQAALLTSLNQPADAATLLAQLAAANQGNPSILAAAGDAERNNNQYQAAIASYSAAMANLGPNPPAGAWSLFFDRGVSEDQLGQEQSAQSDLQEAQILSPSQPYVLNYIAYDWAEHGQHLAQAQTMLDQAVSLDPNDGAVIDSLGYVHLREHHTAQAIALLTRAVELTPDDAEINAHLGDAFAQGGRRLQAVYQWSRALSLHPDPKLAAQLRADIGG